MPDNERIAAMIGYTCQDIPPGSGRDCPVHSKNFTKGEGLEEVKRWIEAQGWGWQITYTPWLDKNFRADIFVVHQECQRVGNTEGEALIAALYEVQG